MRRFKFNPLMHVTIAIIGVIMAGTLLVRPLFDMVIPQETIQAKIDERLPISRTFGSGTVEINKAAVQVSNDGSLNVGLLVDVDAAGAPDTVDADFNIRMSFSEGDIHIDDLTVGRVDFKMDGVAPGSFQYTLLQGVFVAGASKVKQDFSTRPLAALREGPLEQRFLGNLLERVDFENEGVHVTLSPGQLLQGFFFEIILAFGILILAGGFVGRKHRKSQMTHPVAT